MSEQIWVDSTNVNGVITPGYWETVNLNYDNYQYSMLYVTSQLVGKLEGVGNQVAGIANESNAFSTVKTDASNVQTDITNIQSYVANNPNGSQADAAFQTLANQFASDLSKYHSDAAGFSAQYGADGMNEAYAGDGTGSAEQLWNFNCLAGSSGSTTPVQTLGNLITYGSTGITLAKALWNFAKSTSGSGTTATGPFAVMQNGGSVAGVTGTTVTTGLNQISTDFGTVLGNLTNTLNLDGQSLQQDDQIGQSFLQSIISMLTQFANNQRSA